MAQEARLAGLRLCPKQRFDLQPYIVLWWKEEKNSFTRARFFKEMSLSDAIPTEPGVYIIRPLPGQEAETRSVPLERLAEEGDTGLYVDGRDIQSIRVQDASKTVFCLSGTITGISRSCSSLPNWSLAHFTLYHF